MNSITHIITGLNVGGAERALYTLLTNGLEGPFRNRVISLMGPGYYGPLLEAEGIPVSCLEMNPGRPSWHATRQLLAEVRKSPSALLQGWMLYGNLAATFARRWGGRSAALAWNQRASLDALRSEPRFKRTLFYFESILSKRPGAIIHNSLRAQSQYAEYGYHADRALRIPNGFDTSQWMPDQQSRNKVRQEFGVDGKTRVIGYVGRGHPHKDLKNLSAAFAHISEKYDDVVLVAVGRDIDQYITPSRQVKMLGQRTDVKELMRGFDLLCLSSRVEGFPNVIGEAMATGVPCVTTDVGDARDIVGETGWVAPTRDSTQLAISLDRALSSTPQALHQRGVHARERIVDNFSITPIVERYVALYTSLTTDNS